MGVHVLPEGKEISREEVRNLLNLDFEKYSRGFVIFTPSESIVARMVERARTYISKPASLDAVMRVFRHNPDTIVTMAKGAWRDEPGNDPLGFWCHLPLNPEGHDALFDGRLVTRDPDVAFIARPWERPAAIYHWYTDMAPAVAGGLALVMERFSLPRYRGLPMYCHAATATAHSFFVRSGFKQGAKHKDWVAPGMLSLSPPDPAGERPRYDSYMPGLAGTRLGIKVAHGLDDLLLAISIRGAAFVGERFLPVFEDIDGNDMTATHLIGYVGDEPAGCIRIRYFADFVKLERLAVLQPQRKEKLASALVHAAVDFIRTKGYRRIYGQAAEPFLPMWKRFGFEQRAGDGVTYLTDEVYYEIDLVMPPLAKPITHESGAALLVRREGEWHRPGAFDGADAS